MSKFFYVFVVVMIFQLGMITQHYITPQKIIIKKEIIPKIVEKEKIVKVKEKGYHISQNEFNNLLKKTSYISQGMSPKHVGRIIKSTLIYIGVPQNEIPKWTELLLITSQVESDLGYVLKQTKGPAQGIFQLEPNTEKFLWQYLKTKPDLYKKVRSLRCEAHLNTPELQYNIAYASAMTYVYYLQRGINPKNYDSFELIKIHKKHYNTDLGKATVFNSLKKLAGSQILE